VCAPRSHVCQLGEEVKGMACPVHEQPFCLQLPRAASGVNVVCLPDALGLRRGSSRGRRRLIGVVLGIVIVFGQGPAAGRFAVCSLAQSAVAQPLRPYGRRSPVTYVTDAANGQTIQHRAGPHPHRKLKQHLLDCSGSSDPGVRRAVRAAIYKGTSCVPGGGCGTASLRFKALAPASRS